MDGNVRLAAISAQIQSGEPVQSVTVREFLSWFGAQRRTYRIVADIRVALVNARLATEPDFEPLYLDSLIELRRSSDTIPLVTNMTSVATMTATFQSNPGIAQGAISSVAPYIDPTHRISKLAAANSPPLSVKPDATLEEAATLMSVRGFSQLPVMTTTREVKGVIGWASIAPRMAFGASGRLVRDLMDIHQEVRADVSIFQAIPLIVQYDYVLVRASDNQISGIVTASDLSLQFLQLSEPFLLLGEIENHVRQLIGDKFTSSELAAVGVPADTGRRIERVTDLAFGEYVRLLENPGRWSRFAIPIDRIAFCQHLDSIRVIRNDVMHFDTDGISPSDVEALREFARFLQRLKNMGIS